VKQHETWWCWQGSSAVVLSMSSHLSVRCPFSRPDPIFQSNDSSQLKPSQIVQEQSETAYISQGESGLVPDSGNSDSWSELPPKFSGGAVIKFSQKSEHSFRRYKPNFGKMPYLAMLKNPSNTSWIRIRRRMTFKI